MIKVTVIIPVFNAEKYLEMCLDSVFNQTLKDIEVIIIDDGSKDNSRKIIKDYENVYKNKIITVYQANQGVSVCRNRALKLAKGKYIFYMDSDDFLEERGLEVLYNEAESTNSNIVIFAHNEICGNKKTIINIDVDTTRDYEGREVADMVLNCKFLGTPWNKFFLREDLIDNKFTFEIGRYVQDWYPIFKQINKSKKIKFINEALYNYRINHMSTTSKKTMKNIDDYNHAANQIIKYAKEQQFDSNSINKFRALALITIIDRYYTLKAKNNRSIYEEFSKTNYYANKLETIEILKIRNLDYKKKIYLILWNLRILHLKIKFEDKIRTVYKKINVGENLYIKR